MNSIKRLITFATLLGLSFILTHSISAQDKKIIFNGKMDKIYFRNKLKPSIENVQNTVILHSDGSMDLVIENFKMGKMPGKMSVRFSRVLPLNQFSVRQKDAVCFKIGIFPTSHYTAMLEGSLKGNKLEYKFSLRNAKYLGISADITYRFKGNSK